MEPILKPKLPELESIVEYLKRIDSSRFYSNRGPLVVLLEQRFAEKFKIDPQNIVLCSNATAGLTGVFQTSSKLGFESPTFTFPATNLAIKNAGKSLALADTDPSTWLPAFKPISETFGHVVVPPFGSAVDLTRHDPTHETVFDVAAGLANADKWISKIPKSWTAVFSLHATKPFGIGEGGVVVFGDAQRARQFRNWINFGFDGSRDSRILGSNSKMPEISAAVGHAVLDLWEEQMSDWRELSRAVSEINVSNSLQPTYSNHLSIATSWIIQTQSEHQTRRIMNLLDNRQIEHRLWWSRGCHQMPAFEISNTEKFEGADKLSQTYLGLPYYRGMSTSLLETIREVLKEAVSGRDN